jgi:hypothetical protein
MFDKMPSALIDFHTKEGLYLRRVCSGSSGRSGICYLTSTRIKSKCCDICGKRRKTTAHHIIPLRLNSCNKELAQLRVRVCQECEKKIHPENGYDSNEIINKQNKIIKKLNQKIGLDKNFVFNQVDLFFANRLKELKESLSKHLPETLPKDKEKLVIQLGKRMEELKYIKGQVKHIVYDAFNKLKDNQNG